MLQKEQDVKDSLEELHTKYSHLMKKIKLAFQEKVKENSRLATEISLWVEIHLHWEDGTLHDDLDDTFRKIHGYYDFIDCSLIVAMCKEFFCDDKERKCLIDEVKTYSEKAHVLRSSKPITELKQTLRKVYGPFRRRLEDMPLICIQLQNLWSNRTIEGLYILVKNLLPIELKQSLMKFITIEPGSVVITLGIVDCTADSLIAYAEERLQFLRLIGIFSLRVNDHRILDECENKKFDFESALHDAVCIGHKEAVDFLLQIGAVNINHPNDEGRTALMLACETGNSDIVCSLLSSGANVNHQDNNRWTALMIASKHNHI